MRFSSERLQCGFPVQWPLSLYILAVLIGTSSCSHYPIAEVAQARVAGERALDADAPIYAPGEYDRYRSSMDSGQQILDQQLPLWPWSRDYIPAKEASANLANLNGRAGDLVEQMNDSTSLAQWNRLVQTTINQSAGEHRLALIVNKYRHRLSAYLNGYRIAEYAVDLGSNAFVPKRLRGDAATPEGQYHVVKKLGAPLAKYHEALVINYPNAHDHRLFRSLQRRSEKRLRIGGDIAIHGGGGRNKDWTPGGIALADEAIDELFPYVIVGTPVTIVANETVQPERKRGGGQ